MAPTPPPRRDRPQSTGLRPTSTPSVDEDADLDAAVSGVYAGAFGFQGQKCSACSRAIVHKKVYDEFLKRLEPKVNASAPT